MGIVFAIVIMGVVWLFYSAFTDGGRWKVVVGVIGILIAILAVVFASVAGDGVGPTGKCKLCGGPTYDPPYCGDCWEGIEKYGYLPDYVVIDNNVQ